MNKAATTSSDVDEEDRLAALHRYEVVDTIAESEFDDLVKLASQICGAPIALISLVNSHRQWFKARVGVDLAETPKEFSVCQYTIQQPDIMIVPDMSADARFTNNPLVTGDPHLRFYAGAPLRSPSGQNIGTICVLDTHARELDDTQKSALRILSGQVIALLELRLALREKDKTAKELLETTQKATDAAERINLALDSGAVLGTWVWDMVNDRVTGDERFSRTFGIAPERIAHGISLSDAFASIHPEDAPPLKKLIEETIARGGNFRAQYRVREHKRGWLWVEATGKVELNDHGKPVRFPGVLIDIDDRMRLELEMEETTQRYRTLFETIDQGFCIIDMIFDENGKAVDYLFSEVNPAFGEHTGLTNALGRRIKDIAPNVSPFWFETYGRISKTGVSERHVHYDPELLRWFEIYAFGYPASGNKVAVLFSDVTAKIMAEDALRESEERLSLMVESAEDFAIISISPDGIIKLWSAGAERIFGYAPNDAIGQHIRLIFTEEERTAGAAELEMETARKNGRASDERWHERANGERFYASGIMASMRNDADEVTGFVKIARDMTTQQRHQENLTTARNAAEAANIAKTEFLANMSHEIRTPMNAIIGLSNILAMSEPLTSKQAQFVKTLQMSADSLLALINDLLDISKIEARSVELEQIPFSITQVLQETISMMAVRVREKGLEFTAEGGCIENRTFIGDPTRLRQVILNLCSNAIKFTESGRIHISVTCSQGDDPDIETICMKVSDTGIGIAHDKLDTIFHKFVQADTSINRKYGGTGLGLAITKTIVEIMGGTITVESEVGKGSAFTVCIPLKLASREEIAGADLSLAEIVAHTLNRSARPRILLVEDYEPNVIVASTILENYGFDVDVATNGIQAIEKTSSGDYAVVLMDVQMHGMNGFDATGVIRAHETQNHLPRTPIIGMTAHALSGDRERCIASGMDDYISKPFNPQELKEMIESFLSKTSARSAA